MKIKIKHRVNQIHWKGRVLNHGDGLKLLKLSGDVALVERGRPRLILCKCPCGCGRDLTINLDERTGKAWVLYQRKKGLSLYPSVWLDSGCKSHFVIWNDRVHWLDGDWWIDEEELTEVKEKVLLLTEKKK